MYKWIGVVLGAVIVVALAKPDNAAEAAKLGGLGGVLGLLVGGFVGWAVQKFRER